MPKTLTEKVSKRTSPKGNRYLVVKRLFGSEPEWTIIIDSNPALRKTVYQKYSHEAGRLLYCGYHDRVGDATLGEVADTLILWS